MLARLLSVRASVDMHLMLLSSGSPSIQRKHMKTFSSDFNCSLKCLQALQANVQAAFHSFDTRLTGSRLSLFCPQQLHSSRHKLKLIASVDTDFSAVVPCMLPVHVNPLIFARDEAAALQVNV
jgi:hypothetical protein